MIASDSYNRADNTVARLRQNYSWMLDRSKNPEIAYQLKQLEVRLAEAHICQAWAARREAEA